jgi:hypothetical protein
MAKLREKLKSRGRTFLLYGKPGIGKTELAAAFKKPVFLVDPQEDGILDLQANGDAPEDIPVYELEDEADLLKTLKGAPGMDCETVVIETLAGIEALIFNAAYARDKYKSWEKFEAFATGPRSCVRTARDIVDLLSKIANTGKTVVMTAHSQIKKYSNPTGEDYDIILPQVTKQIWDPFAKWFQNVFYMSLDVQVDTDDRDALKKSKGLSCGDRTLHVNVSAAFEAKNRYRLPDEIDMGKSGAECLKNLSDAIKAKGK